MIILKPISAFQVVDFLPSDRSDFMSIEVIDEQTREIVNTYDNQLVGSVMNEEWQDLNAYWEQEEAVWEFPPIDPQTQYVRLTGVFNLKENRTYDFYVFIAGELVYKDKIYCTSQAIDQNNKETYSINEGLYLFYRNPNN